VRVGRGVKLALGACCTARSRLPPNLHENIDRGTEPYPGPSVSIAQRDAHRPPSRLIHRRAVADASPRTTAIVIDLEVLSTFLGTEWARRILEGGETAFQARRRRSWRVVPETEAVQSASLVALQLNS
jgi:hypothetical protein